MLEVVVLMLIEVLRPGFVKGNRPAIVAKVEPRRVKKPNCETLEKLQGVENLLLNTEEIKRYAPSKSDDEQRAIDEGKTIRLLNSLLLVKLQL
jgi:translation initiation factor IF-2